MSLMLRSRLTIAIYMNLQAPDAESLPALRLA
jgi:hypothetical protein